MVFKSLMLLNVDTINALFQLNWQMTFCQNPVLVLNKKITFTNVGILFWFTNIRFLSANIGILFCFCYKVGFLYTIIGILFLFYQHYIALHQYWYIIFCLPMLDSSIPLLVNYLPFTNIGFIYTNIDISCFTNVGSLFTNIGLLFLFCQCWDI